MTPFDLAGFLRDDPVPRLLLLAGRRDPREPGRLLRAAGPEAASTETWRAVADAFAAGSPESAPTIARNSSFREAARHGQEPRYLYPLFGDIPANWEMRAMPTEAGRVSLGGADPADGSRPLRIEGSWDDQVYQWLPSKPGAAYLATARLRGRSSPGDDSSLLLAFLSGAGAVVGTRSRESLPKGLTPDWRTSALAGIAPEGAAWVGVGVEASRQARGDWLEASDIELRPLR
jgi:hypothetical protein